MHVEVSQREWAKRPVDERLAIYALIYKHKDDLSEPVREEMKRWYKDIVTTPGISSQAGKAALDCVLGLTP